MKFLNLIFYSVSALSGAYVGAMVSGDLPVMPKKHVLKSQNVEPKIIRFSKTYACQKSDRACILNGMDKFR